MNAARVTVRGWTLGLRAALGELGAARLCWCLACGRVGLWGWRPLTPSMPITWVCTDRSGCQRRQAAVAARTWRGGVGSWRETARAGSQEGSGLALAPRGWGWPVPGSSCPRDPATAGPSLPRKQDPEGGSR